jgi:hypothetical protein
LAGKPKYSEKICPSLALSTQILHMTCLGLEPGPPRWEAGNKPLFVGLLYRLEEGGGSSMLYETSANVKTKVSL